MPQKSHLKKTTDNSRPVIYKTHIHDGGLISSYGSNINEAVRKRDQIALKSLDYMFQEIKED